MNKWVIEAATRKSKPIPPAHYLNPIEWEEEIGNQNDIAGLRSIKLLN